MAFSAGPAAVAAERDDPARLLGRGELAGVFGRPALPPPGREPSLTPEGRRMIRPGGDRPGHPRAEPGSGVVERGSADAPGMLDPAGRTRPGPFRPRTNGLGACLGIREGGVWVAMAGERQRPPGRTGIRAVRTASEARGRGHAVRLVRALVARFLARRERPLPHVAEPNADAIALCARIGFRARRQVTFRGVRTP